MIENFTSKAMVGMATLGGLTMEQLPAFLMGEYDFNLKCGLFYRQFSCAPETEAELDQPLIIEQLNGLKNYFRKQIQQMIDTGIQSDKQALKQEARARADALNKPHAMGTTAEIAAKYGLSKSEIRKRKAAGTLELLAQVDDVINSSNEPS